MSNDKSPISVSMGVYYFILRSLLHLYAPPPLYIDRLQKDVVLGLEEARRSGGRSGEDFATHCSHLNLAVQGTDGSASRTDEINTAGPGKVRARVRRIGWTEVVGHRAVGNLVRGEYSDWDWRR